MSYFNKYRQIIKEQEPQVKIPVKHPGVLEVPEGKNVEDLPYAHFAALAKKKGFGEISKALTNLHTWNKDRDPALASWANKTQERLSQEFSKESTEESLSIFKSIRNVLNEAEGWHGMPRGWKQSSLKKFSKSLTGKRATQKGFFDKCVQRMRGKVSNPEAFCASAKDEAHGSTFWRGKGKTERQAKRTASMHKMLREDNVMSILTSYLQHLDEADVIDLERWKKEKMTAWKKKKAVNLRKAKLSKAKEILKKAAHHPGVIPAATLATLVGLSYMANKPKKKTPKKRVVKESIPLKDVEAVKPILRSLDDVAYAIYRHHKPRAKSKEKNVKEGLPRTIRTALKVADNPDYKKFFKNKKSKKILKESPELYFGTLMGDFREYAKEWRGPNIPFGDDSNRPNLIRKCMMIESPTLKINCLRKLRDQVAMNPMYQSRIDRYVDEITDTYEPTEKPGTIPGNEFKRGGVGEDL